MFHGVVITLWLDHILYLPQKTNSKSPCKEAGPPKGKSSSNYSFSGAFDVTLVSGRVPFQFSFGVIHLHFWGHDLNLGMMVLGG